MTMRRVRVSDFRCLRSVDVELDARFTLVHGANASGKTSLLEALYVLGRGRSFRTRRLDHLVRGSASKFLVVGDAEVGERLVALGVEGSSEGLKARIAGERPASLSELASVFPVQIIDPEVHRLIEEGPNQRRRYLDWGVFHVEPRFVRSWQGYQSALKQRNAALKMQAPHAVVNAWNADLVRLGDEISVARRAYLESLRPYAQGLVNRLLGLSLDLSYRPGWLQDLTLAEALRESSAREQEQGVTQVGPHRADLGIRLNGSLAKDRISRGQQKLLAAALLLAQLRIFPAEAGRQPTLLLDDPAAELDGTRLLALIDEVASRTVQIVVTTLDPTLPGFGVPGRRYAITAGELHAD